MANAVSGNPLVIDTATATALLTVRFEALAVRWASASTADTVDVQDQNGNTKWASVGGGANNVEESHWEADYPLIFNGLKVPTLDAGTVYIYTKQKPPV